MFALLFVGVASAQQEEQQPQMSGFDASASGNVLFAASSLGENIESGSGYSLNVSYDFINGGAILGPTVSYASFGRVGDGDINDESRVISSYGSAGIQGGFQTGRYSIMGAFELPFQTQQNEGLLFESMLSGRIKYALNKEGNFGVMASYDYFFNKDTFYYTSQAGLGLYIKL